MTSTFHPVTYHSCTGSLVLERDTLTFQADDDATNPRLPSSDTSTRLKWSNVTKLRANKASSRVPKLRFTILKDTKTKKGGREKQSFFTFTSRSELERARTQMKIYLQLHKRLKCEEHNSPRPDPSSHGGITSRREDSNSKETSAALVDDSAESRNKRAFLYDDSCTTEEDNSTPDTLSSDEAPSTTSSEPHIVRNAGAQEDDNESAKREFQPLPTQRRRGSRRRRPPLRKASSDGNMQVSNRRPPLRRASSERDMHRVQPTGKASANDTLSEYGVPPPPPVQPIILTTLNAGNNQDTLVPVVMSLLEQPHNADLQHAASRFVSLQPYRMEDSGNTMDGPRALTEYSDIEEGVTRQDYTGSSDGDGDDGTDSIIIPKIRCVECSTARLCCCFCCIIIALAIFLIVYFTVLKNGKSSADEAREEFFSSADGAFWVRA